MQDWLIEALVSRTLETKDVGGRVLVLLRQIRKEKPQLTTVDELVAAVRARLDADDC
jgi:hypothetical protein